MFGCVAQVTRYPPAFALRRCQYPPVQSGWATRSRIVRRQPTAVFRRGLSSRSDSVREPRAPLRFSSYDGRYPDCSKYEKLVCGLSAPASPQIYCRSRAQQGPLLKTPRWDRARDHFCQASHSAAKTRILSSSFYHYFYWTFSRPTHPFGGSSRKPYSAGGSTSSPPN